MATGIMIKALIFIFNLIHLHTCFCSGTLVGFYYDAREASPTSLSLQEALSLLQKNNVCPSQFRVLLTNPESFSESLNNAGIPIDLFLDQLDTKRLLETHLINPFPRFNISTIVVSSSEEDIPLLFPTLNTIRSAVETLGLERKPKVSAMFSLPTLEKNLPKIVKFIRNAKSSIFVETFIDGALSLGDGFVHSVIERALAACSLPPDNFLVLYVKSTVFPSGSEMAAFSDRVIKSIQNYPQVRERISHIFVEICPVVESKPKKHHSRKEAIFETIFPASHRELIDTVTIQSTSPSPDTITIPSTNPTTILPTSSPITIPLTNPITAPINVPVTNPISTPGSNPTTNPNPTTAPVTILPVSPVTPPATTPTRNPNPTTAPMTIPPVTPVTTPATTPTRNPNPTTAPVIIPPVSPVTTPVTTPTTNPVNQPVTNSTTYPFPPPSTIPVGGTPMTGSGQTWCVAKSGTTEKTLQMALDYACGIGGSDCSTIQMTGTCYNPNSLQSHASYAFNSYYQKNPMPTSCDFGGAAMIVSTNPSTGTCTFPSSSSGSTANPASSIGGGNASSGVTPTYVANSGSGPSVLNANNSDGSNTVFGSDGPTASISSSLSFCRMDLVNAPTNSKLLQP